MDLQESAKQDLFDFQIFDTPAFYDPYRTNIITDYKNNNDEFSAFTNTTFNKGKRLERTPKVSPNNNRTTLRLMLERLDSIASPQKKEKEMNGNIPQKRVLSSAQPLFAKKSNSLCNKYQYEEKERFYESQRLSVTPRRRKGKEDVKNIWTNKGSSSIHCKEERVRALIKKKLAEREKEKSLRKGGTGAGTRQCRSIQAIPRRVAYDSTKPIPKTLVNLLC